MDFGTGVWLPGFLLQSTSIGSSRFGGEVGAAADGYVGKRFGLRDVEVTLFLQHEQSVELSRGILAGDSSRGNHRGETGLSAPAAGTESTTDGFMHPGCIDTTTALYLLSCVQLFQLQQQQRLLQWQILLLVLLLLLRQHWHDWHDQLCSTPQTVTTRIYYYYHYHYHHYHHYHYYYYYYSHWPMPRCVLILA